MNRKNIRLRYEKPSDYTTVEQLTREAFWNRYRPGCTEHYLDDWAGQCHQGQADDSGEDKGGRNDLARRLADFFLISVALVLRDDHSAP